MSKRLIFGLFIVFFFVSCRKKETSVSSVTAPVTPIEETKVNGVMGILRTPNSPSPENILEKYVSNPTNTVNDSGIVDAQTESQSINQSINQSNSPDSSTDTSLILTSTVSQQSKKKGSLSTGEIFGIAGGIIGALVVAGVVAKIVIKPTQKTITLSSPTPQPSLSSPLPPPSGSPPLSSPRTPISSVSNPPTRSVVSPPSITPEPSPAPVPTHTPAPSPAPIPNPPPAFAGQTPMHPLPFEGQIYPTPQLTPVTPAQNPFASSLPQGSPEPLPSTHAYNLEVVLIPHYEDVLASSSYVQIAPENLVSHYSSFEVIAISSDNSQVFEVLSQEKPQGFTPLITSSAVPLREISEPPTFESIKACIERDAKINLVKEQVNLEHYLSLEKQRPLNSTEVREKFEIERKIQENSPLTQEQFLKKVREANLSSEQVAELYKFAKLKNNPYIYEASSTKDLEKVSYSLNFLWINKDNVKTGLLGFYQADFKEKFVDKIQKWVQANPDAKINFWIDEEGLPPIMKKQVQAFFDQHIGPGKVQVRNIREADFVGHNPEMFAKDVPVYFRVDLAKAVIGDHLMVRGHEQYVINVDIDIQPQTKEHIFSKDSLEVLENVGYLRGSNGTSNENSYILLNREAKGLIEDHHKALLDNAKNMFYKGEQLAEQAIYDLYGEARSVNGQIVEIEGLHSLRKERNINISAKRIRKPAIFPPSQFIGGGGSEHPDFKYVPKEKSVRLILKK